ncbi:MAG: hypothetical protein J6A63_05560 [Clostridia bacterium]|nr:hypothetical protein [Clostridia bacterium]
MDKKTYVTLELCICLLSNTDVVRTSLTARDKFDDSWTPGTDDFVQITN